jgi:hypothetical protein
VNPVRSDRRHRFANPPDELWAALARVEDYRRWWPWLDGHQDGFAPGARWSCVVRPPLPYVLRFDLVLEEVEAPRFATATVTGDIRGHAALDVRPVPGGSELRLVSVLAPSSSLLRAVAGAVPVVARLGHDWVLDTGLRQFRAGAFGP